MYESEFFMLSDRVSKVHGLLRLMVAEPLKEKVVFWKDYFDLDYKHVSHHVEAFKASVNRFIEVSLSLSKVHFPQIYGKPEISDRLLPSCSPGECCVLKFPKLPV